METRSERVRDLAKGLVAFAGSDVIPTEDLVAIDLYDIARALDVADIRFLEMVEDGRVISDNERLVIELKASQGRARTRFTLAHELAHIAIWRDEARELFPYDVLDEEEEERLCDRIAGEVLIPSERMRAYLDGKPLDLVRLREVARRTETSLSAVAVAIRQATGKLAMLINCQYASNAWVPSRIVGRPTGLPGPIRLAPDGGSLMTEATGGRKIGSLPLLIGRRRLVCRAEVEVTSRGDRAIVLVTGLGAPQATESHLDYGPSSMAFPTDRDIEPLSCPLGRRATERSVRVRD